MKQNISDEKDREIREYSVRENIFFVTLVSEKMRSQLDRYPREEIMAAVIEIAEQFASDYPAGTTDQLEEYARNKLYEFSME